MRDLATGWPVLAAFLLAGLVFGAVTTLLAKPIYSATSIVYVAVNAGNSIANLSAGSQYTQNVVASLATVATTPIVLTEAAQEIGRGVTAEDLAGRIIVSAPEGTVTLSITASDSSPVTAARIVNAVADSLAKQVPAITSTAGTSSPVRITTIQPGVPSNVPVSPRLPLNLALGLSAGLILGLLGISLQRLLDTRVRDSAEVEAITESAVLVHVPFDSSGPTRPLTLKTAPNSPTAESYRSLRAKLRFSISRDKNVVLVTSAMPAEGKSTTAINLAIAYADAGLSAALVDLDLRRPTVATTLGLDPTLGVSDVLSRAHSIEDVQQFWNDVRLAVFPAGELPPNPAELLSGQNVDDFISELRGRFDVVILDSPPLLPVGDTVLLAPKADGVLLIVADRRSGRNQLAAARRDLDTGHARLIGVVVKSVRPTSRTADARYGYGYNGVLG